MKYYVTRFSIDTPTQELMQPSRELLADACGECGYEAFEDTHRGINGYIQQDDYSQPLLDAALEAFPIDGVSITYTTEAIEDQDWNAVWEQAGFEPIDIRGRVTIYDAPHTPHTQQFTTPLQIAIHTRNAFGTGTHETTRMVISSLLDIPMQGRRVLDCGCGTGILAIAAIKCGATHALAYDIDEWSADNAKHNAHLNGCADRIKVLHGDATVLSHVEGEFDVVLANINRNILITDMPRLHKAMAQSATLIISGFYQQDIPTLLHTAERLGMHEAKRLTNGSWACLQLVKGGGKGVKK